MRHVQLRHTTIESSVLGFGCASLTSLNDRGKALRLLETAFDQGITHYDVARVYGAGRAEALLGEFLKGKRDRVTVTTKFGLLPPKALPRSALVMTIAKRVLRLVPAIDRKVRQRVREGVRAPAFGVAESAASLETSLRELRTDHVDILLLHEGSIADAASVELRRFLEDQIARGTVRYWGIGTTWTRLEGDATRLPAGCSVVQLENDAVARQLHAVTGTATRALITHSAMRPLPGIVAGVAAHPALAARVRDMTGLDVTTPRDAASLLLGYALADNPDGIVLVGTTRAEHLAANVALTNDPRPIFRDDALLAALRELSPTAFDADRGSAASP